MSKAKELQELLFNKKATRIFFTAAKQSAKLHSGQKKLQKKQALSRLTRSAHRLRQAIRFIMQTGANPSFCA